MNKDQQKKLMVLALVALAIYKRDDIAKLCTGGAAKASDCTACAN